MRIQKVVFDSNKLGSRMYDEFVAYANIARKAKFADVKIVMTPTLLSEREVHFFPEAIPFHSTSTFAKLQREHPELLEMKRPNRFDWALLKEIGNVFSKHLDLSSLADEEIYSMQQYANNIRRAKDKSTLAPENENLSNTNDPYIVAALYKNNRARAKVKKYLDLITANRADHSIEVWFSNLMTSLDKRSDKKDYDIILISDDWPNIAAMKAIATSHDMSEQFDHFDTGGFLRHLKSELKEMKTNGLLRKHGLEQEAAVLNNALTDHIGQVKDHTKRRFPALYRAY